MTCGFVVGNKGTGLPINTVVIFVLAILVLLTISGFIMNWRSTMEEQIPELFSRANAFFQPTRDNPASFSPEFPKLEAGDERTVLMQVYNYVTQDVMCTFDFMNSDGQPDVIDFSYSAANRPIPPGMVGQWKVLLSTPENTPQRTYIYAADVDCGEFVWQTDIVVTVV